MIITRDMLRTDLPKVRKLPDGGCNTVLALHSPETYRPDNTYFSPWQTTNAIYYRRNRKSFIGWIELSPEHPPIFTRAQVRAWKAANAKAAKKSEAMIACALRTIKPR